ncbi:hypothetical protein [Streptomyces sp. NPDC049916]|uniref:hypothetical protein n=1 Tax=Streptomyces sp. NPDC049916 TaxID=3155156 RepID=UPI0034432618
MITATLVPLVSVASATAAPSIAVEPAAWTPGISPLYTDKGEFVTRNVSSADRNTALVLCSQADGIACISVGQGDGRHSVFHLFRCETRSLSNFIDGLAVRNNQTPGAQVHFWGPRYNHYVKPDGLIHLIPDRATLDFNRVDLC